MRNVLQSGIKYSRGSSCSSSVEDDTSPVEVVLMYSPVEDDTSLVEGVL